MKKLIIILLSVALFASCAKEHPYEIWDYKLKVFYLDGTTEVLPFKGEPYISRCGCNDRVDGVFLNPAHHDNTPCLSFLNREGQYVSIACGVKRFEVISLKKTTVDPSKQPKVKKK